MYQYFINCAKLWVSLSINNGGIENNKLEPVKRTIWQTGCYVMFTRIHYDEVDRISLLEVQRKLLVVINLASYFIFPQREQSVNYINNIHV